MMMAISNKQHLSSIWNEVMKKLSNTEGELKKALLIKKACIIFPNSREQN